MTNSRYARSALAEMALSNMAPMIRWDLLDEPSFKAEYSFTTDGEIAFGKTGVSFKSSGFFQALREVLSGTPEAVITDFDGEEWTLSSEQMEGKPGLILSSRERRVALPDYGVLANDPDVRLRSLDEAAIEVNLPTNAYNKWRDVLKERNIENEEFDKFSRDLRDTPVSLEQSVRSELEAGKSTVSSLVPSSRRYYERLVGVWDGSESVVDYAGGEGKDFLAVLPARHPYDGFLLSLLLSSHAMLTAQICVDHLKGSDLVRAYEFLENNGDLLSRLGAIEIGMRILPQRPEVESHVVRLSQQIRDDDDESPNSEFKLFSALFILVDGEISRSRLLSGRPPFYRRLASMAHAALIQRQLVRWGVEPAHFSEWAFGCRAEEFYMQSLADMRMEPRWNPDLAGHRQLKLEFLSRIVLAANSLEKNIGTGDLYELVLGEHSESLHSLAEFPFSFFPGPLEGHGVSPNALPDELASFIETGLKGGEAEPSSFIALVNSAMVYRLDSGQAELAAKALRLAKYQLANVEDKSQLLGILNGLGTVAAVTRSSALADELRILVRRYRMDPQFGFSIEDALRICMVASASRENVVEWRQFAGDWLTELAFAELTHDEGDTLYSHLRCLLRAVPELWVSCAKAMAALNAYVNGKVD